MTSSGKLSALPVSLIALRPRKEMTLAVMAAPNVHNVDKFPGSRFPDDHRWGIEIDIGPTFSTFTEKALE